MRKDEFAAGVMDRLGRLGAVEVVKASGLSEKSAPPPQVEAPPVGHPDFTSLRVGETATCELAIAFLDMRAMTARSFWQPLPEVTKLSLAVLGQVAEVVRESGGYILGLRGDGLMAGWGDRRSDVDVDVIMSMAACAFSLDAVQNSLNGLLELDGIAPVQLCAGADHGEVCFARTGTVDASEVNIVGHPANFAAKCEKHALSWEVVVGEGAASAIRPNLLAEHEKSPREYVNQGRRRAYRFYQFAWGQILGEATSAIAQVRARPTSSIDPHWKETVG